MKNDFQHQFRDLIRCRGNGDIGGFEECGNGFDCEERLVPPVELDDAIFGDGAGYEPRFQSCLDEYFATEGSSQSDIPRGTKKWMVS